MLRISIVFIFIMAGLAWWWNSPEKAREAKLINGVNLEAPRNPVGDSCFTDLSNLNANWVAVIPYAFIGDSSGTVLFDHERQWWGEKETGIREVIGMAHENNIQVMLKPQVWVRGEGWPGDFQPSNELAWQNWQVTYRNYLLKYARLAAQTGTEMICVGTEFRKTATHRPEFWRGLIREIRAFYDGKITYAANWDNYQQIEFWDELDYIGIDAYFPLTDNLNPTEESLVEAWNEIGMGLEDFANMHQKKVLFTEYGYRSVQGAARGHWNESAEKDNRAQALAYNALFNSVWQEPWLEGGFLWKWHMDTPNQRRHSTSFSPQKKPAEYIIRQAYSGQ